MPPTKREYDAVQARAQQPLPALEQALLKYAAVQAEALTGRPEWDKYLQLLQAKLDHFRGEYKDWLTRLEYAKSQDDVKEAQINVAIYKNCALVVEEAMQLPGMIIREHQERKDS